MMFLWISSAVLDEGSDEETAWRTHHWFDSRRQFLNRVEDGLAELIRLPHDHPLIESSADIGTC